MSESLNPSDVMSTDEKLAGLNRPTFKVGKVLGFLQQRFDPNSPMFNDGINCQVLRPSEGWRSGKVRVRVEFIPDENQ